MRAALTLSGGRLWPEQSKARTLGVDRLGWETNNPVIDPRTNGGVQVLEPVRANGFSLYLMRAFWGWGGSPEGWAQAFRDDLKRLDLLPVTVGPQQLLHGSRQCALNADLEVDDSLWVLAALKELRRLMPGRGLTWSMQPHKGGIIGDELRDFLNNDPMVTVAPYLYRNNMQRCSETWVRDDLEARGIRKAKIIPYYGDWSEGFDGFLWNLLEIQ